jgi:ribonuclease E
MKLLMPSHAKRVRQYADPVPLFQRYGAEDQLSAMYDPVVQLKSGGYLVINPTEALVSIDINSGRSTKEHGIEQTAVATNLEAAREIARQLRLRDMAGLVVIDFIDMEYGSNIRKVEKAMKDAQGRPRAHPGRPHFRLRPDGNEPPAPAHRRAGSHHPRLPALRWLGPGPHRIVRRPRRCA